MVLLFSTCREAHGVISTHAGSSEGGLLKAIAQICSDSHGSTWGASYSFLFFFVLDFIYLFERKHEEEEGQRGEKQTPR